jgi:hypothetical protein
MTHRQAVARPLAGRLASSPLHRRLRNDPTASARVAQSPTHLDLEPHVRGQRSCRRCARAAPSAAARASTSWTRGPLDRARAGLADRGAGACAGRAGPRTSSSPRPRAKTRVRYRRPPGPAWDELDRDAAMDRHLPTRAQRSNRRPTGATLGSASQAAAAGEKARRGKSGHRRAGWSGHRPGETRGKVPQKHTADGEASRGSRTGKGEMVR